MCICLLASFFRCCMGIHGDLSGNSSLYSVMVDYRWRKKQYGYKNMETISGTFVIIAK